MSIQRRWEIRRPDLLKEGWIVFAVPGGVTANPEHKLFRVVQPNNVIFDEYEGVSLNGVWDRLLAEVDPPPRQQCS